jgi:hypothetical protein
MTDQVRKILDCYGSENPGVLNLFSGGRKQSDEAFWPKRARSATAADSAQLSGGILSSATKRPFAPP